MKRPRDRCGEALAVLAVDSAPVVTNDLSTFLHPLTKEEFLSTHYRTRAVAIKTQPKKLEARLERVKDLLYQFHPLEMLRNSNSEQINVWMKTGDNTLKSLKVGAEDAKVCYEAGHSLYFRANEELEAEMIGPYSEQLGHGGFAAEFRDHLRRGEIETFATHIGHTTNWHWDFQENFTIQLRGAKRWTFKKGPVPHPHRAAATHFPDTHVLHVQNAFHHYSALAASTICETPHDDDNDTESVVLQAGDVMYHPAGIWHKVETIADGPDAVNSLSINISLFPMTWGELMQETFQQLLLKESQWRERIIFSSPADARSQLEKRLTLLSSEVGQLTASAILPNALFGQSPRSFTIRPNGTVPGIAASTPFVYFRRNPLGVLCVTPSRLAIPLPVEEDDDDEDEDSAERNLEEPHDCTRFDYHSNFAADEVNVAGAPAVHCVFFVQKELVGKFSELALLSPSRAVKAASLVGNGLLPNDCLVVLLHVGFLIAA